MKKYLHLIIVLIIGCTASRKSDVIGKAEKATRGDEYEVVTVTDYRTLDGCGFLFCRKDSSLLNPVNLPDSLQKDGLKVEIRFHVIPGKMTTCMNGPVVQIDDIKMIAK